MAARLPLHDLREDPDFFCVGRLLYCEPSLEELVALPHVLPVTLRALDDIAVQHSVACPEKCIAWHVVSAESTPRSERRLRDSSLAETEPSEDVGRSESEAAPALSRWR